MNTEDKATALVCIWRENRGGGVPGMQSVLNVLMNRSARDSSTVKDEALRRLQFTSMSYASDPEIRLGPDFLLAADASAWYAAADLVEQAVAGTLQDITQGATNYYAASLSEPPAWAAAMTRTVVIAGQIFFK